MSAVAPPSDSPHSEVSFSSAEESVEFPYRALNRWAVASVILAICSLVGILFWPALSLAGLGVVAALIAMRGIAKYPEEFSGRSVALFGACACGAMLVVGSGLHIYEYLTEVPEGYTRVQFYKLQQPEDQPDQPNAEAIKIDGEKVFMKGYIHPSSGSGMLRRFIMVPDLGTCCFGGQPRSTDMIEVSLKGGKTVRAGYRRQKVAGLFELNNGPRSVTDFDNAVFYRMKVDQIR